MRRCRSRGSIAGHGARLLDDHVSEPDEAHLGAQLDAVAIAHSIGHDLASAASTSSAEPPSSAWMKLACFSDTRAVPTRKPFSPVSSMSRPAESPGGFTNTEPAF